MHPTRAAARTQHQALTQTRMKAAEAIQLLTVEAGQVEHTLKITISSHFWVAQKEDQQKENLYLDKTRARSLMMVGMYNNKIRSEWKWRRSLDAGIR